MLFSTTNHGFWPRCLFVEAMVAFGEAYFALQNASVQHPFDPFSALVSPTVKHLRHIREHNVVTRRVQNLFPFVQDLIAVFSVLVY